MRILCLSLLLLGAAVSAFRVKSASPSAVKVKQGNSFKVICTTDNWYEVSKSINVTYISCLSHFSRCHVQLTDFYMFSVKMD